MSPDALRQIIKETVKEILDESHDLSAMRDDMPGGSELSEAWSKMLYQLEVVLDEVDGFNERFAHTMSRMGIKQKLMTQTYVNQLNQIVQMFQQLHAPVREMSRIQREDNLYEAHPHGRYAQQAGATPFQAPGDTAIN